MHAVEGVSLTLDEGEVLGIVGESGSGKSVTMLALLSLVAFPGRVRAKRISFAGRDLPSLSDAERRKVIGKDLAMIFQDPTTSLNPCFTIGFQLTETLRLHLGLERKAALNRAAELLEQVGIPAAASRLKDFPHQLSGGMNQRVMIAMAIACNPRLLIADEPTTALDVTVQAEILDLLGEMRRAFSLSLLLITHDLGVIATLADRVAVMYAGRIVEQAPVQRLFSAPAHPYTRGLLASIPGEHAGKHLTSIPGSVPAIGHAPAGCAFSPRCAERFEPCTARAPEITSVESSHDVRCFLNEPATRPVGKGRA